MFSTLKLTRLITRAAWGYKMREDVILSKNCSWNIMGAKGTSRENHFPRRGGFDLGKNAGIPCFLHCSTMGCSRWALDNKQKWNTASRLSHLKEIQTRHIKQNQIFPHESLLLQKSPFPPALVIYSDKFDSKLLHLSKTEHKKEMELYEWLMHTLSVEHWKESTVFWGCTFCSSLSFNKLCVSDFCQLLTAKTICLFFCLYGKVTIIWLGWFITLESKKEMRRELIKLWQTHPRETVNY